jgi:hypothetical protein
VKEGKSWDERKKKEKNNPAPASAEKKKRRVHYPSIHPKQPISYRRQPVHPSIHPSMPEGENSQNTKTTLILITHPIPS